MSFVQTSTTQLLELQNYSLRLCNLQENFPKLLRSPRVFVRSQNMEALKPKFSVAIVGSRRSSPAGRSLVWNLVQELARYDVDIVSGGAFGIDAEAHKAALHFGLNTRAWVVGPVENPSPRSQRVLFEELVKRPGCALLSPEHLLPSHNKRYQSAPAWFWLDRNAWIAADADAVVVIESAIRSGTLSTAAAAANLGIDTYAWIGTGGGFLDEGNKEMISRGSAMAFEDYKLLSKSLVVPLMASSYNIGRGLNSENVDQDKKWDFFKNLLEEGVQLSLAEFLALGEKQGLSLEDGLDLLKHSHQVGWALLVGDRYERRGRYES